MESSNIGLVGCGRWGKLVLRDLVSLGCRVSVVSKSDEGRENARRGKASLVVDSLDELLERPEIEGFVVASSTVSHYDVLSQIVARRVELPVFCEKPVTCSSEEARDLLRRKPEGIFVMDKWRYHPGVERLRSIAESSELGKVLGLRTCRIGWGSPHADVNAVWHLMPHDLSIVAEILGEIPDLRFGHVETFDGAPIAARAVLGTAPWVYCEVSAHSPKRSRVIQLVCEHGVAALEDGYDDVIKVYRGPLDAGDISPEASVIPIDSGMPLLAELRAFVRYVRDNETPPKSPLREAIRSVEIIEAILNG